MKLVMVEWYDSHNTGEWETFEDLETRCNVLLCKSIGWLVAEKNNAKLIVSHLNEGKKQGVISHGCGYMVIPDVAIKEMWILEEVDK